MSLIFKKDAPPPYSFWLLLKVGSLTESGFVIGYWSEDKFLTEDKKDVTKYVTSWAGLPDVSIVS